MLFFIFRSKDITRISPVGGLKERETDITNYTFAVAHELHTEILHLVVVRLHHHRALFFNDMAYPSFVIDIHIALHKTDTPSATAPGGLHNEMFTAMKSVGDHLHLIRLTGTSDGARHLQTLQQLHGMPTMRQLADGVDLSHGGHNDSLDTPAKEIGTDGQIPPPDINSRKLKLAEQILGNKTSKRTTRQAQEPAFGILDILHQHKVISCSPDSRNES